MKTAFVFWLNISPPQMCSGAVQVFTIPLYFIRTQGGSEQRAGKEA